MVNPISNTSRRFSETEKELFLPLFPLGPGARHLLVLFVRRTKFCARVDTVAGKQTLSGRLVLLEQPLLYLFIAAHCLEEYGAQ